MLLAVDPSLTCSGWALFRVTDQRLLGVGKFKSLPPSISLSRRLADLQERISALLKQFELGANDYLVCEAPTTMRDPRAAFKVEQVRGIFEASARAIGVEVPGRINPRSVHFEILGLKGPQQKRTEVKAAAVSIVGNLFKGDLTRLQFPLEPRALKRHQDIVDAILVGSLAVSWVGSALRARQPVAAAFENRDWHSFRNRRSGT